MATINLKLPVKLSPRELYVRAQELARARTDWRELKLQQKLENGSYGKRFKDLEARIDELADCVRTETEPRQVTCVEKMNDTSGMIETVRVDTKQIVAQRVPKGPDKQGALSLGGDPDDDEDDEDDDDEPAVGAAASFTDSDSDDEDAAH